MANLTETMAIEWAQFGIRVNSLAPGYVASSGLDTYDPDFVKEFIPRIAVALPAQRLATEAECASGISFLLSPGAAYITGTCMIVDGGGALNTKLYPLVKQDKWPEYNGFHRAKKPKAVG